MRSVVGLSITVWPARGHSSLTTVLELDTKECFAAGLELRIDLVDLGAVFFLPLAATLNTRCPVAIDRGTVARGWVHLPALR